MIAFRPFLPLCAVLLLAILRPAMAADPGLPPLARPGQWYYVTQSDGNSSSHCIGSPATPLCAVETLLACFQRGQMALCRLVDDGAEQYAQVFTAPSDPGKYLAYRILAARRIEAGQGNMPARAQPGDVLLTVDQREGQLGRYARATGAPAQDFLLHRRPDGRWKIVSWGDPGENLGAH
ncbi:hypothetical protein GALL_200550 [mine drainage metagenome]|uniref:Uncharacterized protein n=1 Tax=mine drainage metagenome TaxID=410659 RepID=A0A1J5RQ73_9ZZZZ